MSKYENPVTESIAPMNESDGMHGDKVVYCPVDAYGNCSYCDQSDVCHITNAIENCDDFATVFDNWEDWEKL